MRDQLTGVELASLTDLLTCNYVQLFCFAFKNIRSINILFGREKKVKKEELNLVARVERCQSVLVDNRYISF